MFQTVIFDLDGTILDTLEDLADAGNRLCERMGWPVHDTDEYRQLVGGGIRNLVTRLSPAGAEDPRLEEALSSFLADYGAHVQVKTAPYPGVVELLTAAKAAGVRLAVLSNKADHLCAQLAAHSFPGIFDVVRGKVEGVPVKPDPTSLRLVMAQLNADPATTLYVGDSDVDMFTAKNGGLVSCGVTWGFRGRRELAAAGADHLADAAEELLALILQGK